MPTYDRAYFDRWYRSPRTRVFTRAEIERRVRFTIDAAEMLIERPVRRVLDVCCGEGHWQPVMKRLRPGAHWQGVDVSDYAVAQYGRKRNIRLGRFGDLGTLGLHGPYDLIVCAGALYYIPTPELRTGLDAVAELLGGLAFLELFTDADDIVGNVSEVHRRTAAEYDAIMGAAGLAHLGMHCWVGAAGATALPEFERGRR